MQRGERLAGARLLLAKGLATHLARILGLIETPTPEPILEQRLNTSRLVVEACYLVERARRGEIPRARVVSALSWLVASRLSEREALEALRRGLKARPTPLGLFGLARAMGGFLRRPTLEALDRLVSVLAGELSRPCWADPRLEAERGRFERAMKRLGAVLGLTLPALFVASLLYSPALALASIAIAALLWALVRRVGVRYRMLNLEIAWEKCGLEPSDLEAAISGRDLPSVYELLGLPYPPY